MNTRRLFSLILLVTSLFVASCEKGDKSVGLPEKTGSQYAMVEMGEDYNDQIFFDLESGKVVFSSQIKSWDLAFETASDGYHVFINGGGRSILVHNTQSTDFSTVLTSPKIKDNEWKFDQSCGLPDSTAIGEWRKGAGSKNEVYILKIDPTLYPDTFMKIQLVLVNDKEYVMNYAPLGSPTMKTITIPKDGECNYSYFSFQSDAIVKPEPPKTTWDIVFTRYRYIYHELQDFTYPVNGVLLNPYNTTASVDSVTAYEKFESKNLLPLPFTNRRDVIGYDWKTFLRDESRGIAKYVTHRYKIYAIKTRHGQYWKLHFLDFYNAQGVKGYPSFEYERLQ